MTRHLIISTAGHIDHGKTALVRALTGMETDRLAEEKRRGITIELGFAFLGDDITIIDVPGHERFIKTMVAGVSTVDLALLIVAADEGVMPQTREHLAILHLLGVPRIFVVLTKAEGQSPEWLALVEEEIRKLLPPDYAQMALVFRCDSLSGQGIDELKRALQNVARELLPRQDSGVFRLPVDRAFSLKGYGTVVTGTILSGQVKVGDPLAALPQGWPVRVRGLQSHTRDAPLLGAGQRAALNLVGQDVKSIQRGDWICRPDAFIPTEILDVSIALLIESPPLKNRDRVRLHIGTSDAIGRILLLGRDIVQPGAEAFAQILLESPIMGTRGDRFILRRYSPLLTLGGGIVLDPHPPRRRHLDPENISFLSALRDAPPVTALEMKVRSGGVAGLTTRQARSFLNATAEALSDFIRELETADALRCLGSPDDGLLVSREALNAAREEIHGRITAEHHRFPERLGVARAPLLSELSSAFPPALLEYALEDLLKTDLILESGYLRSRSHRVRLQDDVNQASDKIQGWLEKSGLAPLSSDILEKGLGLQPEELYRILTAMQAQGRIIKTAEGLIWSAKAVGSAWEIVRRELSSEEGKTTSQLREALGCPRRQAVALLEYFDRSGRTERRGDRRLPGPDFDAS